MGGADKPPRKSQRCYGNANLPVIVRAFPFFRNLLVRGPQPCRQYQEATRNRQCRFWMRFATLLESLHLFWSKQDRIPNRLVRNWFAESIGSTRSLYCDSGVQLFLVALNAWLGVQFYLWVRWAESGGRALEVARPAGVEGWLPIEGLMQLKYFLLTPGNCRTCMLRVSSCSCRSW